MQSCGHPFFSRCILVIKICSLKLTIKRKKKMICEIFHQKKNQKVLMKIEEMADVFLNSANFASHAFLTLAPPSGYALNLKALIKVSKVSWTSQLSYWILWFSFERKFKKDKIHFSEKPHPKTPVHLGLKVTFLSHDLLYYNFLSQFSYLKKSLLLSIFYCKIKLMELFCLAFMISSWHCLSWNTRLCSSENFSLQSEQG